MSSKKISALTAYTAPIDVDEFPVVDKTTNTTKKITYGKIFEAKTGNPLIYKALVTQSGTNAPSVTVLINTFPAPLVPSYSSVGVYNLTLTGAFTVNKTAVSIDNFIPSASFAAATRSSADVIELYTVNLVAGALQLANGVLGNALVTIEVYP